MKKQRPSGRKPIKDKICLGVYITTDKHERLMEIADKKELTLSNIVRMAINEFIAKEESEQ